MDNQTTAKKRVVVVGGGAGGLELVAKLCDAVSVTLIDKQLKHIWKPLYHEVAAGTLNNYYEEIDYISYSYQKGFTFIPGEIKEIDRQNKRITVEPLFKEDTVSVRQIEYDVLVLAIGSETNDFHIPGVKKYSYFLDSLAQAELCNKALLKQILLASQPEKKSIHINIIGGGATGVELAAEFNHALSQARKYQSLPTYEFSITVIESGKRILDRLPDRVSQSVKNYLQRHNINILTQTKITEVKENAVITSEGEIIPSAMTVWAAGIKCHTRTIQHDLDINSIEQFHVKATLQATKDDSIFAFGDCASCPQLDKDGNPYTVPPRAQAAYQQAIFLKDAILNYLLNKPLSHYRFKDYGSLVSLSRYNVVGNLMNRVTHNLYIEGWFARLSYHGLYKRHLWALKGFKYVVLSTLANFFMRKQRPEIKLH